MLNDERSLSAISQQEQQMSEFTGVHREVLEDGSIKHVVIRDAAGNELNWENVRQAHFGPACFLGEICLQQRRLTHGHISRKLLRRFIESGMPGIRKRWL